MKQSGKGLTRRQFITSAAALSGAAMLPSCSGSGSGPLSSTVSVDSDKSRPTPLLRQNSTLPTIIKRPLGKTGLQLSVLAVGGGSVFTANSAADQEAILTRALELGINYFDTSSSYGSEAVYGKILCTDPQVRSKVIIGTKVESRSNTGTDPTTNYELSFANSLTQLNTSYVDLLSIHDIKGTGGAAPENLSLISSQIWPWMVAQKTAGKAKFIGFSSMSSYANCTTLINTLNPTPDFCIIACSPASSTGVQGQGNKGFVTNTIPAAMAKNVGVLAIKSMNMLVNTTPPLATPLECLGSVLKNMPTANTTTPGVTTVIVGFAGLDQLNQNAENVCQLVAPLGTSCTSSSVIVDQAALEKRIGHLYNPEHMVWMRDDYCDGKPYTGRMA